MTEENQNEISKVEKPTKSRGRKPGCEKTGGRKKGTPNKNSATLRNALDENGFNLIEEFVRNYDELKPTEKFAELKWLMSFMYPRLAEVEKIDEPGKAGSVFGKPTAELLSMVQGGKK
jgi:hypothetical protein